MLCTIFYKLITNFSAKGCASSNSEEMPLPLGSRAVHEGIIIQSVGLSENRLCDLNVIV